MKLFVAGLSYKTAPVELREIGVRLALGASRGDVERMIVVQVVRLVVMGVIIGSAVALAGSRLVRSLRSAVIRV